MTPTEMDQLTTPAEPSSTPETATYSPPPARVATPIPSAWAPAFVGRERRWWTIALAATLLISATGIGLLYVDDSNNQATIHSLTAQNESLKGRNQILQDQVTTTQTNLTATLNELATTRAKLEHPTLGIWNVPQTIRDNTWYLASGIPDTFTYHIKLSSTGSMNVSILTLEQFADAIGCIDSGAGVTNWCMHHRGTVQSWLGVTSVSYDFHLAEGCADYMMVITAPSKVTVTPDIQATYNPASDSTGSCR
jgi:cell division protein FtsB